MGNPPKSMQTAAYGSRKKAPYKKKQYKRSIIPSAPANNYMVKLNYTENIRLDTLLGSIGSYVYRINDLFDPNFSGTGHQPYFRDQMYALYNYGKVLSASIKCNILTNSNMAPCYVVLTPLQSGVFDTNLETAAERKGSKETYLNGNHVKTLTCSSTVDYYFGQAKGTTLHDTTYLQNSTTALSVGNRMNYGIGFSSLDASTMSIYVKVDIQQIVRFEQPVQQSGS